MTEKKAAYVSYMSYNGNSYSKPHGSISIYANGMSINLTMNEDECSQLEELALSFAEKRKHAVADDLKATTFKPLLTYDSSKTIDADGAPTVAELMSEGEKHRATRQQEDDDYPF